MYDRHESSVISPASKDKPEQHILFVDDEPNIANRNRPFLERAGYSVTIAASGKEAIGILAQTKIDLVVVDAMMPEMSGAGLTKYIKEDPCLSHIPIIMMIYGMSGPMTPEQLSGEAAMSQDRVRPIIFKTFEPRDLIRKVKSILNAN